MRLLEFLGYIEKMALDHQVDPMMFAIIYLVSTPPFLIVGAWIVHRIHRERPLEILLLVGALLYAAPYIYILIVGRGVPLWTYVLIGCIIAAGLAIAVRGVMREVARERD